jgi:hypothetical protein
MPTQTDSHQTSSTNTTAGTTPSKPSSYFLTILRGQTTNVLHMDNAIIDFHIVSSSPHIAGIFNYFKYFLFNVRCNFILDIPDPSAVVVLLENDLVVIDLKSDK